MGLLSALIASAVTGALFLAFGSPRSADTTVASAASTSVPTVGPVVGPGGQRLDIQGLLAKSERSVIAIHAEERTTSGSAAAAGSGIILSNDGLVLTNAHVVQGASRLKVTLLDGTEKTATLVGALPDADVALVRIRDGGDLVPADLGSSAGVKVGDEVVAVGNAFNLGGQPSVTYGIVSAKDRTIQSPSLSLSGLIQTDAAINPGNSGGPLLNAQGQVVGINTVIVKDGQNVGFAIAIDTVKSKLDELRSGAGSAYLGVTTRTVADLDDTERDQFGVARSDGALVDEVVADSPAAAAGLQRGDVITTVDGTAVADNQAVGTAVRRHRPGDRVAVSYERRGTEQSTEITLGTR